MRYADEFTPANAFERMAGGTDIAVDVKTAAEGGAVVTGKETSVAPGIGGGMGNVVGCVSRIAVVSSKVDERRSGSSGGQEGNAMGVEELL